MAAKSKNQRRREKAKFKKNEGAEENVEEPAVEAKEEPKSDQQQEYYDDAETAEQADDDDINTALETEQFAAYKSILDKFKTEERPVEDGQKVQVFYSDDDEEEEKEEEKAQEIEEQRPLTKKELKRRNKKTILDLKMNAPNPELIEWYDEDARDPDLLVQMKSARGAVPIPGHWQHKREYLAYKRGPRRRPFQLPEFIKATGIMEMRDVLKEDDRTLAQKTRERVQPKMGTLDLDYNKVKDAFFKHQTKPRLYGYGDLYYEGRENEKVDFSKFRPGEDNMTKELRDALNIQPGVAPPWIINMKRFGKPPSYEGMFIKRIDNPKDMPMVKYTPRDPTVWGELVVDESDEEESEGSDEDMDDDNDEPVEPQKIEQRPPPVPERQAERDHEAERKRAMPEQTDSKRKRRRFES